MTGRAPVGGAAADDDASDDGPVCMNRKGVVVGGVGVGGARTPTATCARVHSAETRRAARRSVKLAIRVKTRSRTVVLVHPSRETVMHARENIHVAV